MSNTRAAAWVVAVAAVGLALPGCGGSSGGSSGSGSTASGDWPATRAAANKRVQAAMEKPSWNGPNENVDLSALKGKTVWYLSVGNAIPFVNSLWLGFKEAAEAVGVKPVLHDGKFSVDEYNKGFNQALAQNADAIISAVPPETVGGPLAKAKKQGVPVIDMINGDKRAPLQEGILKHVTIDLQRAGQLVADHVIASSKTDVPHIGVFQGSEFGIEKNRNDFMRAQFDKLCPKCVFDAQDIKSADNQTKLGSATETMLRRDPKIEWVTAMYDGQLVFINPAVERQTTAKNTKTIGADAVPENLKVIRDGGVQVADVGEPSAWAGWAAADSIFRAMVGAADGSCKVKTGECNLPEENVPLRFFTKDNVSTIPDLKDEDAIYGGDFRSEYGQLWGLQGSK